MGNLHCPLIACPLWKKGGCRNYTENISIHKFPINKKIRELWEAFVSEQNGVPFKSTIKHGLCGAHFPGRYHMSKGRISRDAKPTLAPMSTKKVLCKWDAQKGRLVPIESPQIDTPQVKKCGNHLCKWDVMKARLGVTENHEEKEEEKTSENHEKNRVIDPVNMLNTEDIQDLDNFDGILSNDSEPEEEQFTSNFTTHATASVPITSALVVNSATCAPSTSAGSSTASPQTSSTSPCIPTIINTPSYTIPETADDLLPFECLKYIETASPFIPKQPQSLGTIADVETAILREKNLAMLRYQQSVRKIKGLEVVLKRLKDANAVSSSNAAQNIIQNGTGRSLLKEQHTPRRTSKACLADYKPVSPSELDSLLETETSSSTAIEHCYSTPIASRNLFQIEPASAKGVTNIVQPELVKANGISNVVTRRINVNKPVTNSVFTMPVLKSTNQIGGQYFDPDLPPPLFDDYN